MQLLTRFILCLFLILAFLLPKQVFSQAIPIGSLQDEQLKLHILLSDSLSFSAVNLPFSSLQYREFARQTNPASGWWSRPLENRETELAGSFRLGVQPAFIQNTMNSRFPQGENNQAAWYGRGMNTEFTAGLYLRSDYLSIQFHPHIIYQQNQDFLEPRYLLRDDEGNVRYAAEAIGALYDAPFRFGPDAYTTFDWGNSSIRLHYNNAEIGISSEPLWWGPAVRYPLAMSNNAAGIYHVFAGTRNPFNIPYVGNLQFRWVLGYPKESDYYEGAGAGETRFLNAVNLAFSPAFFKNLTVGITRIYHLYEDDGFDFRNVTLIFNPFRQTRLVDSQGNAEERQDRNQMASVYAHILFPEANAEIYGEFYKEDHNWDTRDFLNQPQHNGAWMVGFQKIFYAGWIDFIKTNLELTSLSITQLSQVRHQTYIYTHSRIRQGHTNRGEVLGAAIGPGSNSQFLSVDAYKDDFKAGLFIQRVADNENFHLRTNSADSTPSDNFGDYFRHRINLNIGANFLYGPGPYYLTYGLKWTKAYNYGRFDYGDLLGVNVTNYERNDRINVQFQLGIRYVF